METVISIVTSLLSGFIATMVTLVVTNKLQKKRESLEYKRILFQNMIAFRGDLVAGSRPTGNFSVAINQVFIAYNDCPEVLAAFEAFRKLANKKGRTRQENDETISLLITLLKAMAKEINIDYSFCNDDLFTTPVIIAARSDTP